MLKSKIILIKSKKKEILIHFVLMALLTAVPSSYADTCTSEMEREGITSAENYLKNEGLIKPPRPYLAGEDESRSKRRESYCTSHEKDPYELYKLTPAIVEGSFQDCFNMAYNSTIDNAKVKFYDTCPTLKSSKTVFKVTTEILSGVDTKFSYNTDGKSNDLTAKMVKKNSLLGTGTENEFLIAFDKELTRSDLEKISYKSSTKAGKLSDVAITHGQYCSFSEEYSTFKDDVKDIIYNLLNSNSKYENCTEITFENIVNNTIQNNSNNEYIKYLKINGECNYNSIPDQCACQKVKKAKLDVYFERDKVCRANKYLDKIDDNSIKESYYSCRKSKSDNKYLLKFFHNGDNYLKNHLQNDNCSKTEENSTNDFINKTTNLAHKELYESLVSNPTCSDMISTRTKCRCLGFSIAYDNFKKERNLKCKPTTDTDTDKKDDLTITVAKTDIADGKTTVYLNLNRKPLESEKIKLNGKEVEYQTTDSGIKITVSGEGLPDGSKLSVTKEDNVIVSIDYKLEIDEDTEDTDDSPTPEVIKLKSAVTNEDDENKDNHLFKMTLNNPLAGDTTVVKLKKDNGEVINVTATVGDDKQTVTIKQIDNPGISVLEISPNEITIENDGKIFAPSIAADKIKKKVIKNFEKEGTLISSILDGDIKGIEHKTEKDNIRKTLISAVNHLCGLANSENGTEEGCGGGIKSSLRSAFKLITNWINIAGEIASDGSLIDNIFSTADEQGNDIKEEDINYEKLSAFTCEYIRVISSCTDENSNAIIDQLETIRSKHKLARCISNEEVSDSRSKKRLELETNKKNQLSLLKELLTKQVSEDGNAIDTFAQEIQQKIESYWENEDYFLKEDIILRKKEKLSILQDYLTEEELDKIGNNAYKMNLYMTQIQEKSKKDEHYKLRANLEKSKKELRQRQIDRIKRRTVSNSVIEYLEEKIKNSTSDENKKAEAQKVLDTLRLKQNQYNNKIKNKRTDRKAAEQKLKDDGLNTGVISDIKYKKEASPE